MDAGLSAIIRGLYWAERVIHARETTGPYAVRPVTECAI